MASSLAMCNFVHQFSHYSIAHNLIFTAYTLSPTFPNCLSSVPQMEPTPSQVRNHYWQKNQDTHHERALAFTRAANLDIPSNVWLQMISRRALSSGWLLSAMSLVKQFDDTIQDICVDTTEGESKDLIECTVYFDIERDNLHYQQDFLLLGEARRDKSLWMKRNPLAKKWSCADTVTAHPLLPTSWKPPGSVAPPLLKHQQSALLIKSSKSDCTPSAQVLPQSKCSGDQNASQPKARSDQNVPQHQKATYEVMKTFMKAIQFMKTPCPIFFQWQLFDV